jgi:hypothetical protein
MKKLKIAAVVVLGHCALFASIAMLTRAIAADEASIATANLERVNRSLGTSYTTLADAVAEDHKRRQPAAAETTSIRVRGRTLRIGDTADDIFKTLKPADSKTHGVEPGATRPGNLVTHHYEVEGTSFSLTFARNPDPGPYRLHRITTSSPDETLPVASTVVPTEDAVDCVDLRLYAKSVNPDLGFFDLAILIDSARKAGNCT